MGFKEDMERRKQQKEARDYFRQNNDQIANTTDLIKVFVMATLLSTVGGMIIISINMMSYLFYVLLAYGIAYGVAKFVDKSTTTVKVMAIVGYLIGIYLSILFNFTVQMQSIAGVFVIDFGVALVTMLQGNLFSLLSYVIGAACIYFFIQ
ncbi:hypothetical protein [Tannockella kyphosi]|uniref:hypothetical protein n=1 Tax=Tannockella kyphosi TaxID=2899121 RepID=UPI0020116209|nr:hypothetical protein [Tannockella kyphosi]